MRFLGLALLLLPALAAAETKMFSRDLGCQAYPAPRSQALCRALEDGLQWTWFGHATVSPGWRPSFEGTAKVFCAQKVAPQDIDALLPLTRAQDWRLESAAKWLVILLGPKAIERLPASALKEEMELSVTAPNSIWNPAHPDFPVRRGCKGF